MADQGATIRRGRASAISRVNPKGTIPNSEGYSSSLFSFGGLASDEGATIRRGSVSAISRVNSKGAVSGSESYYYIVAGTTINSVSNGISLRAFRYRPFIANPANVAYDTSPADNIVLDETLDTIQAHFVSITVSVTVTDTVGPSAGLPVFVYTNVFSDASVEATDAAAVAESVTVDEGLVVVRGVRPTTVETVTLTELVTHVRTSSLDVSDSFGLLEDQIAAPAAEAIESVTVSDQVDLILGIAAFETVTITEASSLSAGKSADVADTIGLFEEATPAIGQVQSESVTVSEVLVVVPGIQVFDTYSVTEAVVTGQGHVGALDETVIVNDANVSGDGEVVTESVTITEDIFTSPGVGTEELLNLTESLTARAGPQIELFPIYGVVDDVVAAPAAPVSEVVVVTDDVVLVQGVSLFETVSVTEFGQIVRQALPETFHTITIFEAVSPGYAFFLEDLVTISDAAATTPAYNPHVSENVVIVEVVSHAQSTSQEVTDTVTVSEELTEAPGEQVTESVTIDDAVNLLQGLTLFETVSIGEFPSTEQTGSTDVADSVTVTDSVAVGALAATTEAITVTDQATTVQVRNATVAHVVTVTEAVNLQIARTVGLSDSISTTEAFGNMASFAEDVEETVTVSDAADIVQDAIPAIQETVSLTEAIDHIQTTSEDLPETVTVSDSVFESNNIPIDVTADTTTVTDSVLEHFSVYPDTTESVSISEVFDSLQTGDQPADETVSLTESISEATSTAEVLLETVTVSDAEQESLGAPVSVAEAVNFTEAVDHLQTFEEPQVEAVTISEALVESEGTAYALNESVSVTEAQTEVFDVRPTTDETVTITEAFNQMQAMEEVPSDTVSVTDDITIGFPIDVIDSVTLTETIGPSQEHLTNVTSNDAIAEGLFPLFGGTIEEAVTVTVTDGVDYSFGIPGTVAENVAVSDGFANQADFLLDVSEVVTVTETRLNADQFSILFDTVVVNETLDLLQTFSQEVAESLTVSESFSASRHVSPILISETVSVADGSSFLGSKNVLVNDAFNVVSGIATPYAANVLTPVSLSITENAVVHTDYIRDLSEIVTVIVSAFTEGSAAAAALTPTTVQMFVGTEVHPNALIDLVAYDVTPVDGGVPVMIRSVELVQPIKESGRDASVQEGGYHIFFPYTEVVDVGDYLDIEGALYSFSSLRITSVDNVNQVVAVDRRVISTDPKNGELTWTLKRAAVGSLITISEATANATYRIRMNQLDKKTGGFVDVDTTFVALNPEPISEAYSTDPLTGSITITFSRPIAVEPALLRPSLYSVSGPSEVRVVSVSMPAPNQVLVRTTPTFVSGAYHLAFPPLRDQALNRIGV